jgi:chromate transporter
MNEKQKLKEVAALFLKLGIIGFEVPLPHLYDEEVVVKKSGLRNNTS